MKKFPQFLLLIILGPGIMSDIQAVTDTSEYKQPYYTVQISYAGTGAEFRLNDIPFYLESFSGQVDVELPVSDKMISGVNELSIIVFTYIEGNNPVDNWDEDARVEAALYVREKNTQKNTRKLLTQIKLHPAADPEVAAQESMIIAGQKQAVLDYEKKPWQFPPRVYDKQIVISRLTHNIKTPFSRWEWQDGQVIEDTEENYQSLLEAYRKKYVIHQKQDLVAARKSSYKLAAMQKNINYYDDIEQAYEALNLEESWKSNEQVLFEFIEKDKAKQFRLKLDIIGNGKLARITSDEETQPILYIIKRDRITVKYQYIFYKNKQGEWIYIM